jgi:hypothetical protein
MDTLLRDLATFGDLTPSFTLLDVAAVFGLSLVLCFVVGLVYRATHRGVSYSQSYVQTLVLMGVTVAFLMLVIGSNVARAFTLVGALSVIRFRHAMKETRDVGFVFAIMSIGMSVGTRFYGLAIFATFCLSAIVVLMHRVGMFAKVIRDRILIVRVPGAADLVELFSEVYRQHLDEWNLISVESVTGEQLQEAIYSVVLKRRADPSQFLEAVRAVNGNQKASLLLGQHEVDL